MNDNNVEQTILVVPSENGWDVLDVHGKVTSTFLTKDEAENHARVLARALNVTVVTSFVKPKQIVEIAPEINGNPGLDVKLI